MPRGNLILSHLHGGKQVEKSAESSAYNELCCLMLFYPNFLVVVLSLNLRASSAGGIFLGTKITDAIMYISEDEIIDIQNVIRAYIFATGIDLLRKYM